MIILVLVIGEMPYTAQHQHRNVTGEVGVVAQTCAVTNLRSRTKEKPVRAVALTGDGSFSTETATAKA